MPASAGGAETRIRSLGGEDPLEKDMAAHLSILAWRIHGQRSLAGYCLWSHEELDTTEHVCMCARAHTHTHTKRLQTQTTRLPTPQTGCPLPRFCSLCVHLQCFINAVSRHLHTGTVLPPFCPRLNPFFFLPDCYD